MRFRLSVVVMTALTVLASETIAQPAEPKPAVAVFDIVVEGLKIPEGTVRRLTRYLGVRLMMGGRYQIIPEDQLRGALTALKLDSQKDCYDDKCRVQLGLEVAASSNLIVNLWKVERKCQMTAVLYDLRTFTGQEGAAVRDVDCGEAGLTKGIEQLAEQLGGQAPDEEPGGRGQSPVVTAQQPLLPPPPVAQSSPVGGARDALPPPVKAQTGFLVVEGQPRGARVDITGPASFGSKGTASTSLPVRSIQVPVGEYRIQVSMDGHDTEERTVRVHWDATEIVKIDLVQSFAQIQISGRPEGAKGRLQCQKGFDREFGLPSVASPWTVTVPRGPCRMVVEGDGYGTYDETFDVAGGSTVPRSVELVRFPVGTGDVAGSGIRWVRIPGGTFRMGSNRGTRDEKPVHAVTVGTFEIAATEVTVAQYRKCVNAGVCTRPHWDDGACFNFDGTDWKKGSLPASFRNDNQPVVCIDWNQAATYAEWVGGRLPTEAEWEYAARSAGRDQKYPWGDRAPDCTRVVFADGSQGCGRISTWPVCSRPSGNTAQGLCDVAGNAWEWVSDWYDASYYEASPTGNPSGSDSGSRRVMRGGSWFCPADQMRAANRFNRVPNMASSDFGFRPVRTAR